MKTKQILFFTLLAIGFIVFASMRPENIPNNYHNFIINDTIDSLKNKTNTTTLSFDDLGFGEDLEEANQNLEELMKNPYSNPENVFIEIVKYAKLVGVDKAYFKSSEWLLKNGYNKHNLIENVNN